MFFPFSFCKDEFFDVLECFCKRGAVSVYSTMTSAEAAILSAVLCNKTTVIIAAHWCLRDLTGFRLTDICHLQAHDFA